MSSVDALRVQAGAWGLRLGGRELDHLLRFTEFLAGYQEANVIGTRDFDSVMLDHIADSLSCFLSGVFEGARTLVDVGSGGGLPGVPLAIVEQDLRVTLVEATGKKTRFLNQAIDDLGLTNVAVSNTRVEELGQQEAYRGAYDVATARALARLSVVAEYCVPLLRVGGCLISMKGRLDEYEITQGRSAAEQLGAEVEKIIRVPLLPQVGDKERHLVVVRKVRETPGRYPRSVGVPAKKPLGLV
jgi:16S rRNA (guanine527-N7)-methyltransferase